MKTTLLFFRVVGRWLSLALGLAGTWTGTAAAQAPAPLAEAHCLLLPLAPALRAQQSILVVEAEVLSAQSFWDAGHGRLFTRHRLRVFSLLKGQVADTTGLTLLTEGGRLGLDQQILTNTLRLVPGQQGVFFLTPAPWPGLPKGPGPAFTPFGSEQGFIEYNPADGSAAEPFRTYAAIDAAFYQEIARLAGQPRRVLQALPMRAVRAVPRGTLAPTIAGLSPARLPAGTGAVLTITGDGFGTSRGSGFVEFRNADDGGATRVKARNEDYLSWTNTLIEVRVPSSANGGQPVSNGRPAGSGPVRVTTNDQMMAESAGVITVIYALTNVENTDGTLLQRPNHVAMNSTGGITFRFGPNFTASPAPAPWQRALATWRCQTGMNWEVGPPNATNAIADDGQNVVAFDNGPELPALVLGRTTSYYSGCYAPNGQVVFWVKEIDMQFDDAAVFQFGPGPALGALGQIDFESVAVHELGHAQQLAHLILPGAVMHFGVARGQNTRSLNPLSDVAGGRQVLRGRSFKNLGCSGPALLPAPLISFSAKYAPPAGVTLTWATRDECFLTGFVIEHSQGTDTTAWTPVGTVAPRPPAAQYQFTDEHPAAGLQYYRLRLQRPGGSLDNVAPALVSTDGAGAGVNIFPNPVTDDRLFLQYPADAAGTVVFYIYDAVGRLVRVNSRAAQAGLNVLTLDVAGLRPGLYVLHWRDAQGRTGNRKFVK